MRHAFFALLLSGSFLVAQNSNPNAMSQDTSKDSKGPSTIQGCVTRSSGDYVLVQVDPAVSYELQAANKIKLSKYLGQQVEVTGKQSPTLATSSDTSRRAGSSVTLTITSIKTLNKECPVR
ncbi:MAG: hypothetical protein WBZ01_01685 [Terriglobales bacterium]|jgi:hypothetical protein